jgi:hypothetical protein
MVFELSRHRLGVGINHMTRRSQGV